MTEKEANKIVDRLKNGCVYHRFDEPGVYAEYVRAMMRYNHKLMDEAVSAALEDDSKNVPPISELAKAYKKLMSENRSGAITPHNEQYCEVCDDKGFVLMTEMHEHRDERIPYQFVLYCPYCAVGQSWAYNGRNCSKPERRTEYIIPPLTRYFDECAIEEMRRANLEKKNIRDEREGMRLESMVEKIGRRI